MVAPRTPLLCWARPSGRLLSLCLVPVLVFHPPPYSMAISSGSRSPLRGQVAVCWWVCDNPAPRARARAQVAALATRGTDYKSLKTFDINNQIDYRFAPPDMHRRNASDRYIRTHNSHFVSGLSGTEKILSMHLWD